MSTAVMTGDVCFSMCTVIYIVSSVNESYDFLYFDSMLLHDIVELISYMYMCVLRCLNLEYKLIYVSILYFSKMVPVTFCSVLFCPV
jgi:hypothetical protein